MAKETSARSGDVTRDAGLQRNPVRNPEDWTTGDEPMSGQQASYLRTLLGEAGRPAVDLDESTTKAQASQLIDELARQSGRGADED